MTGANDINDAFRGGGRSVEFLDQINKASIVMLDETAIVPHGVARKIASGIAQLIESERHSAPRRSADYLDYEPRLTALSARTLHGCTPVAAARISPRLSRG
jgi:argininosuccinate lyase